MILLLLLSTGILAFGSPSDEEIGQMVSEMKSDELAGKFDASIDFQFTTNGPVQQGFAIPRLFAGVSGQINSHVNYVVAAAEARQSSSLQLPFLVPKMVSLSFTRLADSPSTVRVGLFRPWLNPEWSEIRTEFPDYLGIHSQLLLSDEMGVEGVYALDTGIDVGVGMTNGNGLIALNTNNSRAFHLFVRSPKRSDDQHMWWGASLYSYRQSTQGAANYRGQWVGNVFIDAFAPTYDITAGIEFIWGGFVDNFNSYAPQGWAANMFVPFLGSKLMLRAEQLINSPSYGGNSYKRFEIGPVFHPTPETILFLTEQYTEPGVTAGNLTTFLLLRVNAF